MGLPQIISRNIVQGIPTTTINLRKVLTGGTDGDWYTCPTGKRAIIKGKAVCTGLGAAANVNLKAGGLQICQWKASAVGDLILVIQTYFPFEVQLDAGDKLLYDQDSGTNGEMNMICQIQETPA